MEFHFNEEYMTYSRKVSGDKLEQIVCIEELSELQKAVTKALRGKLNRDNLIEEIADCLYCIRTLQAIYNITCDEIQNVIDWKTVRSYYRAKLTKDQRTEKEHIPLKDDTIDCLWDLILKEGMEK